jgi:hypothetical protein
MLVLTLYHFLKYPNKLENHSKDGIKINIEIRIMRTRGRLKLGNWTENPVSLLG